MTAKSDQEIRTAECFLINSKPFRLWIVPRCPWCGKRHTHGAGRPQDNPQDFLGHRIAHCSNNIALGRGYDLVEIV